MRIFQEISWIILRKENHPFVSDAEIAVSLAAESSPNLENSDESKTTATRTESEVSMISPPQRTASHSLQEFNTESTPLRDLRARSTFNIGNRKNALVKETHDVEYHGFISVSRREGLDITNKAIAELQTVQEAVSLIVTPASITLQSKEDKSKIIAECKLRYLSFYAIGKDIKKFAFICANPEEQIAYKCFVLSCNLGAGKVAQSVEKACKTRISHAKAISSLSRQKKALSGHFGTPNNNRDEETPKESEKGSGTKERCESSS